jgi:hypothetical protein
MTTDKYYEITCNSDTTEGRGSTQSTGINFEHYSDAMAFVKSDRYRKWGVMGTTGSEYDIKEKTKKLPRIYQSLAEYDAANPDKETLKKIKEEALAKLSPLERKALGLD